MSEGAALMPVLRAVLYDLDGVLIDSMQAWFRVIRRGARELGHDEVTFEYFRRTFGQGVEADRREFFPEWTIEEVEAFYERALADELDAVEVDEAAGLVLQTVRERGLKQAVVTNTPLPLARKVLRLKGLDSHLDALACAGEAAEKPAPDLIWLALRRLGASAGEALYIGDSETDRRAARAAGICFAGLGIAGDVTLQHLDELLAALGAVTPRGPGSH